MEQIIKFTDTFGIEDLYPPEPASKNIPEWYKDMGSYLSGEKVPDGKGLGNGTIKRCMPVFDSIISGYIIKSPVDIYVSQTPAEYNDGKHFDETGETIPLSKQKIKEKKLPETVPYFQWSNFDLIQFHPIEQAPTHPNRNGHQVSYPKWINPWSIKTPPGYSTMFVQPWHRESIFTILPGIVDTDTYTPPVNFPFVLNDVSWSGLIPAGTPIAQVIPFKREVWEMQMGDQKDLLDQYKATTKIKTKFFDSYKSQFRALKEYR
jgi:hypothetical protein